MLSSPYQPFIPEFLYCFRCKSLPKNKQQKHLHSSLKQHKLCELESGPTEINLRFATGFKDGNRTRILLSQGCFVHSLCGIWGRTSAQQSGFAI